MSDIHKKQEIKESLRVDKVHDGDIRPVLLNVEKCLVTLQRWSVEMKFGRPTLICVFSIEEPSEYRYMDILKYYEVEIIRVYKRKGLPDRIRFKCSWRRDWAKQFVNIFGMQEKNNEDFLNPDRLANHVLVVSIRTKKTDTTGLVSENLWESKIDKILEISA